MYSFSGKFQKQYIGCGLSDRNLVFITGLGVAALIFLLSSRGLNNLAYAAVQVVGCVVLNVKEPSIEEPREVCYRAASERISKDSVL